MNERHICFEQIGAVSEPELMKVIKKSTKYVLLCVVTLPNSYRTSRLIKAMVMTMVSAT